MKYLIGLTFLLFTGLLLEPPVFAAGPYADELSKCLVRSTTTQDKTDLVQWIFATMALHPGVKSLATVSADQRSELNRKTARLFEKLLTESCLSQTREAVKYEGAATFQASFGVLGQAAVRELFADASVAGGSTAFGKEFDEKKLKDALKVSE